MDCRSAAFLYRVSGDSAQSLVEPHEELGASIVLYSRGDQASPSLAVSEVYLCAYPRFDPEQDEEENCLSLDVLAQTGDGERGRADLIDAAIASVAFRPPLEPVKYHGAIVGLVAMTLRMYDQA